MLYSDPHIQMNILANHNWELWLDGVKYTMEWINGALKVSGPNVCYWLYEKSNQLVQASCDLKSATSTALGL